MKNLSVTCLCQSMLYQCECSACCGNLLQVQVNFATDSPMQQVCIMLGQDMRHMARAPHVVQPVPNGPGPAQLATKPPPKIQTTVAQSDRYYLWVICRRRIICFLANTRVLWLTLCHILATGYACMQQQGMWRCQSVHYAQYPTDATCQSTHQHMQDVERHTQVRYIIMICGTN